MSPPPPTVLLTGASKGIGLATAQQLLADGARVVAVQRSMTPDLHALAEKYPEMLHIVQGDFAQQDTISRALSLSSSFDAVILNAATNAHVGPLATLPLSAWEQTFATNVFGVVRFLQAALPVLRDGGRVVLVSSAASEFGFVATGPYAASKAALNSINRTIAAEHPNKTCIAIHPGSVRTEMQTDFIRQAKAHIPASMLALMDAQLEPPAVPARVIADLALRARAELSGRYLHWNDPALAALREA